MVPRLVAFRRHGVAVLAAVALAAWLAAFPGAARAQERPRDPAGENRERAEESAGWRPGAESRSGRERPRFDATLPVPRFGPGRAVRAGDRLTLRWPALPAGIEEFEVLLSIDGGRTFRLRATPDLEAGETRYDWTVPNLDVRDARFRIRARIDDREIEGPAGAPFAIAPDNSRPRERWLYHDRGWWEEPAAGARGASSLAARPGGHELGVRGHEAPLTVPPRLSLAPARTGPLPRALAGTHSIVTPSSPPDPIPARCFPRRE